MQKKSWNTLILELLSERPIAFSRSLAALSNSATAGLLMSQLLYWWGKGYHPDWIYKTIEEIHDETWLTRSEQDTAIKKWIELGVLKKERHGTPPKRHFQIDTKMLLNLLKTAVPLAENGKLNCERTPYITESTSENTNQRFRTYSTTARQISNNENQQQEKNLYNNKGKETQIPKEVKEAMDKHFKRPKPLTGREGRPK